MFKELSIEGESSCLVFFIYFFFFLLLLNRITSALNFMKSKKQNRKKKQKKRNSKPVDRFAQNVSNKIYWVIHRENNWIFYFLLFLYFVFIFVGIFCNVDKINSIKIKTKIKNTKNYWFYVYRKQLWAWGSLQNNTEKIFKKKKKKKTKTNL